MEFTTSSSNTLTPKPVTSELEDHFQKLTDIDELKNTRFSGDQYRNNDRNLMMKAAVDAVNRQKKKKIRSAGR